VEKDPSLATVVESVHTARSELEEAARFLGSYARSVEADPQALSELEERLHEVSRLVRKHGRDLSDLLARATSAREELEQLEGIESRMADVRKRYDAVLADVSVLASGLSEQRRAAAAQLGEAITAELQSLGMGNARVEVEVASLTGTDGFAVDGARLSAAGLDHVEFLIAPNPGEDPRPLRDIASGGELSRSLLGVKRVLAQRGPVGTYVFDEVDSGVGGAIAEVIGRKLADVGKHHQVLCITHLPQVAAYGERHLLVRKTVRDERTHSEVVALTDAERREELARMMGGVEVTPTQRKAAAELMDTAQASV
jgi:DNA repair protein RecN (Recombination protein N)